MKKMVLILLLASCSPGVNKQMSYGERQASVKKAKDDRKTTVIFFTATFLLIYGLAQLVPPQKYP